MIIGDNRTAACRMHSTTPRSSGGRRLGRVPARPGDTAPRPGRGLLRGPGLDGRARRRARHRPRPHHRRRRQRRRRARRGGGAAGPRPRRPAAGRPDADVPDARRPQRHPVVAPDGRTRDLGPRRPTNRLDRAARRRARRPRRLARTPPRPARPTCPACRPRSSTSARPRPSATRTWPTPAGSGRPAARPSCTSGRAASTASTDGPGRGDLQAAKAAQLTWLRRLLSA